MKYQERLEALNLPTLNYIIFLADMIETYKTIHGHFEDKSTNTRGHQYAIKSDIQTPLPEEITIRFAQHSFGIVCPVTFLDQFP